MLSELNLKRIADRLFLLSRLASHRIFLRASAMFVLTLVVPTGSTFCYGQGGLEQSVIELVEIEAQAALNAAGKQKDLLQLHEHRVPDPDSKIDRLFAIYGVNKKLTAELLVDSTLLIFQTGRTLPILGQRIGEELVKIEPPCIVLSREGRMKELCLQLTSP